ncbi:migration and invasion enhancer 1 [Diabrotica virgifera virgifera]|uniref:Migration and invasion enhancer 1 n=1 Tax=Diabrotica virgifera virgifera TaxID=50390 RepID=A0A6P7FLF7_DIAVI|nr:migration and invasion enhancer 1 [Diabrotica virgifera virgifera]
MSDKDNVEINIEYCNKCGFLEKYEELVKHLKEKHPSVKINGQEGRRGSFEVSVNGTLVHSKLSTLAYPDYDDLSKIVSDVQDGNSVRAPCKQQAITSCSIS